MSDQFINGDTIPLTVTAIDVSRSKITGLTDVLLTIRRDSDDYYLDFDDATFKVSGWTTRQQAMGEKNSTYSPGVYFYNWITAGINDDKYHIEITSVTAANGTWSDWVYVGGYLSSQILACTTIATLTSQTVFTLTNGSADNNAYNEAKIVIIDAATSKQKAFGSVADYDGAGLEITLGQDPGIFTMAVGDKVYILPSDSFVIFDTELLGSTHNVKNSLAKRTKDLQEFGTYEDNRIWLDSIDGTTGTTDYEHGTILNKLNNTADADTIEASLNIHGRGVSPGSSFTLTVDTENQDWKGVNYTVVFDTVSISDSLFSNASISGICTGANPPAFKRCIVGNLTVPPCRFHDACEMEGILILPVGEVHIHNASGEDTYVLDFGTTTADTTVHMTDFAGNVIVRNLGQNGTDILNITGHGKMVFEASCVGGTVNWDGHFTETNNGAGITFNRDDISTNVDFLLETIGADSSGLLADLLAMVYENGETFQTYMRLTRAGLAGNRSGFHAGHGGTGELASADGSKPRITSPHDSSGNTRGNMIVDGTD